MLKHLRVETSTLRYTLWSKWRVYPALPEIIDPKMILKFAQKIPGAVTVYDRRSGVELTPDDISDDEQEPEDFMANAWRPPIHWNQGDLGSCFCVSIAIVVHQVTGVLISPMALYWYTRRDPRFDVGCTMSEVVNAFRSFGVVMESDWPYDPSRYEVEPPDSVAAPCRLHIVRSVDEAKCYLDSGRVIALDASLSTKVTGQDALKTGVIPFSGSRRAGHVMVGVGYTPGGFLVDMNWEKWWGYHGYGLLPYQYFERCVVAVCD